MGAECLRMLIKEGLGNVKQTLTLGRREPSPAPLAGLPKVTPRVGEAAPRWSRPCAGNTGGLGAGVGSSAPHCWGSPWRRSPVLSPTRPLCFENQALSGALGRVSLTLAIFGDRKGAELVYFDTNERQQLLGCQVGGAPGHTRLFALCRGINVSRRMLGLEMSANKQTPPSISTLYF